MIPFYPVHPLTPPRRGADEKRHRPRLKVFVITKIPVLPIAYVDAYLFLAAITGESFLGLAWRPG